MQSDNSNILEKLAIGLLTATLLVIGFNAFEISQLSNQAPLTAKAISNQPVAQMPAKSISLELEVIPKGVPRIYGKELGVSFDGVSPSDQQKADAAIQRLGILDQQISLSGKDLERYISIASRISCEYCCGVESIIFSNGKAACGCQHSFAMRGLAKYLVKNHGNEFSNDEILEELGKWKTLFFPSQISKKALALKEKGVELNYINLASNKYRGIENPIE